MPIAIIANHIAQNATIQQIPNGMALNPFFDAPAPILGLFGIPTWVPLTLIIFALTVGWINIRWWKRMAFMRPVRGYRDTLAKATREDVQTWVLEKTMNLTIEMLRYIEPVLSYYSPTRIQKWIHNTRQSVMHCGGLPALFVSPDFDMTRDIVSEIALTKAMTTYNQWLKPTREIFEAIESQDAAAIEKLKQYVDNEHLEDIREALAKIGGCDLKQISPITSYSEYDKCGHKFLRILWPKGISIPSYSIYNPTKFSRIFPKGCNAGLEGGILIRESKELKPDKPREDWKKDLVKFGIVLGICALFIISAWMVPLGGPHT